MEIIKKQFNNNRSSRGGHKIDAIVLHIASGSIQALHNWAASYNNRGSSWHYGISKAGEIFQYCPNQFATWHAGISWRNGVAYNPRGVKLDPNRLAFIVNEKKNMNPNAYTVGIEHEGMTGEPWTEAMYQADVELIKWLCKKYNIPMDRNHIIGHYQIDHIDRPSCPGSGLDWNKLFKMLKAKKVNWKTKYQQIRKKLIHCRKMKKGYEKIIDELEDGPKTIKAPSIIKSNINPDANKTDCTKCKETEKKYNEFKEASEIKIKKLENTKIQLEKSRDKTIKEYEQLLAQKNGSTIPGLIKRVVNWIRE
ncbi:MAG: N-acetylmuramoyl-L-alanine amidase [Promethearchaeota archaeon]